MINNSTEQVSDIQPIYNQIDNSNSILKDKAAATIQKYVRGYLARKPYLPTNLYSQYYALCQRVKATESHSIPHALAGKTKVYLPQEMPLIVLKDSGRKQAITRFHQMQNVRSILNLQNSSHLIIPKASLCQDFIIEQRLPINPDSFHNMGLYLSEPQMFDEAVREFTRLFSKIYLDDLLDNQSHAYGRIRGIKDFVRYDNIPLYIVEEKGKKEGKIGLIDLERLYGRPHYDALVTLARIFPLHLDVIKDEASKLKMEIDESLLEASAKSGKKYLQVSYTDHVKWLEQKGVLSGGSCESFQISSERERELTTLLEEELLKLNQGVSQISAERQYFDKPQKNFFTENPEKMAKELAASILPLFINNIKAIIEKSQNKQSGTEMTDSQLVSLRSPIINRSELYKGVKSLILENEKIKFEISGNNEIEQIAIQLTSVFMYALEDGGELFYFDPGYYKNWYDLCWIRF